MTEQLTLFLFFKELSSAASGKSDIKLGMTKERSQKVFEGTELKSFKWLLQFHSLALLGSSGVQSSLEQWLCIYKVGREETSFKFSVNLTSPLHFHDPPLPFCLVGRVAMKMRKGSPS